MATTQQQQSPSSLSVVAVATTLFGTLIASQITRAVLYRITNNDELWFFVFIQLFVLATLATVTYRHMFKPRGDDSGEGYRSRLTALLFLQLTALLTAMRYMVDMTTYAVSITPLSFSDYYILFSMGLTGVFVLLFKLQLIIE
jgi:hypothetical protein